MDNRDLLLAYQEAVRRAQLAGRPISKEEIMASMYPVLMQYRKQSLADQGAAIDQGGLDLAKQRLAQDTSQFGQTLAEKKRQFDTGQAQEASQYGQTFNTNRDIYNNAMNLERSNADNARRLGYLNVGIAGAGAIGTNIQANRQNDTTMRLLKLKYPELYP